MTKIILVAILIAVGWYGYALYQPHQPGLVQQSSTKLLSAGEVKCISKEGRVFYGKVPHGIICEKIVPVEGALTVTPGERPRQGPTQSSKNSPFQCDGRIYCSQMTSCAEAVFFLKNCPSTRLDANSDGVPCEKQWCTS